MPRNPSGVYTLPAGNPVISGTLIETTWANPTMSDIAVALTGSLPRDGSAPMQGPLILAGNATLPLEPVALQQLTAALANDNNYLVAGALQAFAMVAIPSGWLMCDGSAVSRATYANLFSTIGTTFGAGDGSITFNLPDLRGQFVRGFDAGKGVDPGRVFGTTQAPSNQAHTHTLTDPGHSHTQAAHSHGVNDPGHAHNYSFPTGSGASLSGGSINLVSTPTSSSPTGISIASATPTINSKVTGITAASSGGEARPTNVAMVWCIKAFGALQTDGLGSMAFQNKETVNITGGAGVFTTLQCTTAPVAPNDVARLADIGGNLSGIYSDDPAVLVVDNTTPAYPILRPQTNIPNGMLKLNAAGYVPPELITLDGLNYQGPWDASPGLLPTGTFADGDFFEITTAGTLTLNTTVGSVAQPCNVGDNIVWSVSNPTWPTTGFYYSPASVASSLPASAITFTPASGIVATNVQAAVVEVQGNIPTTASEIAYLPTGTVSATDVQGAITELDFEKATVTALNLKAPIASPTFTGTVTAPQKYNVSGASGALQVNGVDAVTFDATGITSGVPAGNGPAFNARQSGNQVVTPAVAALILLTNEEIDTASCFASSRFTPNVAGYYQLNGHMRGTTTGTALASYVMIYKNGVLEMQGTFASPLAAGGAALASDVAGLVYMNGSTDYLELWGLINATGTCTIDSPDSKRGAMFSGFLARRA